MAEDIAPTLLEKIQKSFQDSFKQSKKIQAVYRAVKKGTATYAEVYDFAVRVGEILADAFSLNLSSGVLPDGKMYYNIAKSILPPTFRHNYDLITEVVASVQEDLNAASGLGLKAQIPAFNENRLSGIINRVSSEAHFDDVAWILQEPTINFSLNIVDEAVQANATFQTNAGMHPKIIRRLGGDGCLQCRLLAGTYTYPNVPKSVYQRHENCRCTVEYDPNTGIRQNVHTKQWTDTKTGRIIKSKYAPSARQQMKGITLSREAYGRVNSIVKTHYPQLTAEDGAKTVYDPDYAYRIRMDEDGRVVVIRRVKLN